ARASPHRHLLFRALLAARHRHGAVHAALLRADRGLSRGAALRPAALAVCHRRFCDRLDFPVYRSQDRREKAVLFQGCAVPADRAGVADELYLPQTRPAGLSAGQSASTVWKRRASKTFSTCARLWPRFSTRPFWARTA